MILALQLMEVSQAKLSQLGNKAESVRKNMSLKTPHKSMSKLKSQLFQVLTIKQNHVLMNLAHR